MLTVETIGRIRREHFIKGKTIREIARDLKVSRNTVRRLLRSGETAFEYELIVQPRPRSSSKIRINVSCSRADLAAFAASKPSSSTAHRPSFDRGCTCRSYSKEVSPDLSTFRTVFRETFRSRAISLIVLPLMKCSRRIRAIVSTTSIP